MEKEWQEMSVKERQESRFNRWLSPEGLQFESPDTEAAYKANITRLKDTVQLQKAPDRVPVFPFFTFMPANLYGVKTIDVMNDPQKLVSTWMSYLDDYAPDFYISPALVGNGKCFETLDYKQYRWPGHGVSDNSPYQMVEDEYMKEDEYPALIDDPTDFWLRTYMPRMCGALEPLKAIGAFTDIWEMP
ncbi:MAG: uroporphyrinogen decarboxylase, partial [Deltaproteobacteria bacterium]|nr:uroporphyrinogen decarboxylase [Deltaproteobacteria bacterium]